MNDPCALGALRAFEEARWDDSYAVMGQGGAIEARKELRRRATHLIGTVGFFPETYGESIMRIADNLLNDRAKPSAVFTKHQLITAANVDRYYPNDLELRISNAAPVVSNEFRAEGVSSIKQLNARSRPLDSRCRKLRRMTCLKN